MMTEENIRKLATIRRIKEIKPHPNADKLDIAIVDGWQLVTAKDNGFSAGDLIIYFEIDSWIPTEIASFLSKGKEPREHNGVKGERLRTIRLRGELSQGLIIPISDALIAESKSVNSLDIPEIAEGVDITELLGIQKWEKAIPAHLQGRVRGNFPSFIRKTDQERVQNLVNKIFNDWKDDYFEVSLKLDGSSCTVYYYEGRVGVCSRNLELEITDDNKDNSFVRAAYDSGLVFALESLGMNIAVQAELMGPGIQGNREGLNDLHLFMFDVFDIDKQEYLGTNARYEIFDNLIDRGVDPNRFQQVPIYGVLQPNVFNDVNDILKSAEGQSLNHNVREGIVFKSLSNPNRSFKAISNNFLLKENYD